MARGYRSGGQVAVAKGISTNKVVELYEKLGDQQKVAERLKVARGTVQYHLRKAGHGPATVASGRVQIQPADVIKKPRKGRVKRFIFSALQNNTFAHPSYHNMLVYRDYLTRDGDTCEFILGSFSYNVSSYGAKSVKKGRSKADSALWYEPELLPFVKDDPIELAGGLLWGGNHNSLPTMVEPLLGLDRYSGRRSLIVPHVKQHLRSVPSMANEPTKFLYSTGGASQRNYIQKRAGIIAEPEHVYGGLLVEIDGDGDWFCRHLVVDDEGTTYDVGPSWANGCVRIKDGKVTDGWRAGAFNSGDVHVREMWPWVAELTWGEGGIIDTTQPLYQFFHDIFTMSSRGHHDMRNFGRMYEKHLNGEESVEDELNEVVAFLGDALREDIESYVVHSNHDRHLERWLDDTDYRRDLMNSEFYLRCRLAQVRAIRAGQKVSVMELMLRELGAPSEVGFLNSRDPFVIFKDFGGGIECALHGDSGPNGAKGTSRNLRHLSRRVNKGHDHTAFLDQCGVGSAGATFLDPEYGNGPSSWSVSDIITYQNAARAIITLHNGKWRA